MEWNPKRIIRCSECFLFKMALPFFGSTFPQMIYTFPSAINYHLPINQIFVKFKCYLLGYNSYWKNYMLFRGKENFIFTLIIDLNKNLNQKSFVLATVQTCYAVELFLLFLLVINPDHWISSMLFQSFGLLILLAALLVTLLLQLFVVMKWRVHFQLYNQFLFFRYIVFPLLVFFLCAEIR